MKLHGTPSHWGVKQHCAGVNPETLHYVCVTDGVLVLPACPTAAG